MKRASDFLIINGIKVPCPAPGLEIIYSQTVDSGRNADNAVVGQRVGRGLWKLNNLHWNALDADTWAELKKALDDFFVLVTFTGDDNKRHTITMYPSDITSEPLFLNGVYYKNYVTCKFNLIDCGWEEDD